MLNDPTNLYQHLVWVLDLMDDSKLMDSGPVYFKGGLNVSSSGQLMVNWWFGARWFGFLGSPSMKGILTNKKLCLQSQTSKRPNSTNEPLAEMMFFWIKNDKKPWFEDIHQLSRLILSSTLLACSHPPPNAISPKEIRQHYDHYDSDP